MASNLPPGELVALDDLVTPTTQGIASRVLAGTAAGNITLFAFDAGEELSEHTPLFDAPVVTLSGSLTVQETVVHAAWPTLTIRFGARRGAQCLET